MGLKWDIFVVLLIWFLFGRIYWVLFILLFLDEFIFVDNMDIGFVLSWVELYVFIEFLLCIVLFLVKFGLEFLLFCWNLILFVNVCFVGKGFLVLLVNEILFFDLLIL